MRVFLIGYMGSGKTTVGKELADMLSLPWHDLDMAIEMQEGRHVGDLIEEWGEMTFREIERDVLHQLLVLPQAVVSVGGGTPCFYDNMERMKQSGTVIYLCLSAKKLAERLQGATEHRPLLKGLKGDELIAHIEHHLAEREAYYLQADIVLEADAVTSIASTLHQHLQGHSR